MQTQIAQDRLDTMKRLNRLLELMNVMQDNMGIMAKRLVKLEEKVNKNESE